MADEAKFTPNQQSSRQIRQADLDRTLAAMHRLEAALGSAAPGRTEAWSTEARASLGVLHAAIADEDDNAERIDSLLSDIKRTQPLLASRARGLRAQYRALRDGIESLRGELEAEGAAIDYDDLRQRLSWLLTALRHQQAHESDLIYEAYYDAFEAELRSEST